MNCKGYRAQIGTSLLEVLIAVVVLSIGMLGLAGLQVAGLRVNQGALQRSQATILAYDILDRMRGDRTAAIEGDYDLYATVDGVDAPVPADEIADLLNDNLSAWGEELGVVLPGAEGLVCRTNNPAVADCTDSGEFFVVRIGWNDENDRATERQLISVMGQL
jgi:type IV pilus assembly protein PilV